MKLYELTDSFAELLERIEAGETGEDYTDTLESIEAAIEDKAESIVKVIRSLEAQAEAIRAEEKRLADRRKHFENEARRLKDYLKANMEKAKKEKIKTPLFTVSVRTGPAKAIIEDEERFMYAWPAFVEHKPSINKRALLEFAQNMGLSEGEAFKIVKEKSLSIR